MKNAFKIRLFTVLAAILTIMAAPAQTHYKPHVSIGGHGGVAMSKMSFSPEVPQGWAMGPNIGIHARYAEERLVGIVGELNFVQRGWKESFEDNPALSYTRTLTYITLPIMTHIYFGPDRFKFYFNLGPEFGLMVGNSISSNFDYSNPGDLIDPTRRYHQMSMAVKNHFDYGITAGFGMEFYVNPRNSVSVEARFYYGLGNIFPSSKADEFSASRSMSLGITAGYSFRLK